MPRSPPVSITLHACPRCGWPDDEERASAAPAPRVAPPAESPARPRGRPRTSDPLTARDYGLRQDEWARVASGTPATDWYRREYCEREGHTHGEEGLMQCLLDNLARGGKTQQRATTMSDTYRREVCEKEGHRHGPERELDCMLTRLALVRGREVPERGRR